MKIKIITERLVVREFVPEDANALYEILSDRETMRYCEPPYSFEKTQEFLMSFCIARHAALAVEEKMSRRVIGYILFNDMGNAIYEAGWIFNRTVWRRGYAYEAIRGLFDCAFNNLCVHKIFSETIDTVKSTSLMKKLGMKMEGIDKDQATDLDGNSADLYLYSLSAEEYKNNCI